MENVKRQRKRIGAVILCLSIIAATMPSLPGGSMKVYAASPDISQFATKAQLQSGFGLDTGDTVGKIKFGAYVFDSKEFDREWLIAGADGTDTIALLSTSPFDYKSYDDNLSTYGEDGNPSLTSTVKAFLSSCESAAYFSNLELALMKDTMVWTTDYNDDTRYVTGKLYLPDAAQSGVWAGGSTTIYAGSSDTIPIVSSNWPHGGFWLRSPWMSISGSACVAWSDIGVREGFVTNVNGVVPAFDLDLSSVLFASAAPAAAADGALTASSTMTVRYDADGALGGVAYSGASVTVSGVPETGTYLVVQNSSGAWAKAVSGSVTLSANEINSSLTSLEDCEIWLEKTDAAERITTATRAVAAEGNYTATASANTLAPVTGADDAITLTVKEILGSTDISFSGTKNVTITGVEAAPDGTYGSFNGTDLDASSAGTGQTISVNFEDGVATANLELNKADAQTIGFSIATVATPATNTLTITPTHGASASMAVTRDITAPTTNGGSFARQPIITLKDAYGNVCTGDSTTVVTAAKEDEGAWTLTGTTTATAISGVAAFTDLGATNTAPVSNAQLGFTAAGLAKATSGAVTLLDSSPGIAQFATKEELRSGFRLDTGDTVGRIKFGVSGREWLIAGADGTNAIALLSTTSFGSILYDDDLSTYGDDNDSSLTSTVKTFLSSHETTDFSDSELALMKNTTVSTKDHAGTSHNVTGRLYLPDVAADLNITDDAPTTIITKIYVGSKNDIPITSSNWPHCTFWLRSPYTAYGSSSPSQVFAGYFSSVGSTGYLWYDNVNKNHPNGAVPTFDLDLSSVLFASVASAAASDGALTTSSAMTLRYDANGALGSAVCSSSGVTVSGAPAGTYLVVQNKSGAWAKAVSGDATLSAGEIDSSLTSLVYCDVWLETTDTTERITTATRAVEAAGNHTATAGANTLIPVVGVGDTITLTVKDGLGNTDTNFDGAKNVTITGVEAAPGGTYGSFNGTALDASSAGAGQVISVTFTDGVATANLKLNKADAQTIGFSLATATTPATNTLTITPAHGAADSMAVTQDITAPASNGGNFAQQPRITIKDAYGNTCIGDNTTVVTAAKEDAGTWTLTGTTTATASSGVAIFTNLGATNTALVNNAQLGFTSGAMTKVTSTTMTLAAPTPYYTVTYNPNGADSGSVPTDSTMYYEGYVATVSGNTGNLSRTGYVFNGWNTAADGSGTSYAAADAITFGTGTGSVNAAATLYAQWSKNNDTGDTGSTGSVGGSTTASPTTTVSGSTATTTIPGASMQALASGGSGLTVSSALGSVTFGANALKTISGAGSGDVTVTVSKADTSALSDAAKQAVGNRPVYTFSVTSGGKTISQFGGTVTASIPYTPAAGEDLNAIVVYYINANGELETVTDGHYDTATGTVVFDTNHFSTYAVGYNKVSFTDVSNKAWYADAVTFLAARGITSGTTATTFGPDTTLTRGQFITMLLRAYGIKADANSSDNFSDAGDTYYTGYLAAAKRLNVSGGVGNNMFAPDKAITRQEMFTMLYNALKALDKLPEGTSGKTLSDFEDAGSVASWATDAMTALVKAGTVSGSGGKFNPTGTTTRAEMAQVLYNLLSK